MPSSYRHEKKVSIGRPISRSENGTTESNLTDHTEDMDAPLSPLTPILSPNLKATRSRPRQPSITVTSETRSQPPSLSPSPSPPESLNHRSVSLATRLSFLSSLALSEQAVLPSESLRVLHDHLDIIQHTLSSTPHEPPSKPPRIPRQRFEDDPKLLNQSQGLLSHLTNSVATLRKRHDETLHLHSHLTARIDSLVSTNQAQLDQIDSLTSQVSQLKTSNEDLSTSSDDLQTQIVELEAREEILEAQAHELHATNSSLTSRLEQLSKENSRLFDDISEAERTTLEDQVALEAMSAAVGGLEGWMDSFVAQAQNQDFNNQFYDYTDRRYPHYNKNQTSSQREQLQLPRQEPSVRGRGRFRGRYNSQSDTIGPLSPPSTPSSTLRDFSHTINPDADHTITSSRSRFGTPRKKKTPPPALPSALSQQQQTVQILEFEEGIRSWIKGFRDVEESIRTRIRGKNSIMANDQEDEHTIQATARSSQPTSTLDDDDVFAAGDGGQTEDDDFGDFQSPG